jgi:hypothetical protein
MLQIFYFIASLELCDINKLCNAINKIKILADNTYFFHVMTKTLIIDLFLRFIIRV